MSDTQNKWVPVSERLPSYADTTNKLVFANGIKRIAWCDCYRKTNVPRWCEPLKTEELKGVTHWMDLPKPPAPPKPADPFEAWWEESEFYSEEVRERLPKHIAARAAWNAAKEHYAKPKDYQRGFEDSVIAFESMVGRILEGKEDGTGKLEIPQLEKLRRVLLERLKPLPDFETWAKAHCADGDYIAVFPHPFTKQLIHIDNARGIWNAAQGKPEA